MSEHRVEDDLRETWVEEFAAEGCEALERLLTKYARFHAFLEETDHHEPL